MKRSLLVLLVAGAAGCPAGTHPDAGADASVAVPDAGDGGSVGPGDAGAGDGGSDAGLDGGALLPTLASSLVSKQFDVAEAMRAGIEFQLSGEPFATLQGYNLTGFNRSLNVTDQYSPGADGGYLTDILGYAMAIETYEYSKQPMNELSFESGAGLSLQFGPVLNPTGASGDAGYQLLAARFQQFAAESNASGPTGKALIVSPAPDNPLNWYGWPGLWPEFAEFESFDPTIYPLPGGVNTCTFNGSVGALGYGGGIQPGTTLISNYECDYNSLNLKNRDGQVKKVLAPDALGYVTWKQGLWSINYWGTLQDTAGNGITQVAPGDLPQVGQPGNQVVGEYPDPKDPTGQTLLAGSPGVYLGDIPMEGWQGLTMQEEIDDKAEFLLTRLLTADGATLTSAASLAGDAGVAALDGGNPVDPAVLAADGYDYQSPLVYFPWQVGVLETPTAPMPTYADKYFPQPTSFAILDGGSELAGLSGLVGGFGEAFAFTDRNNAAVGGADPFLATYDGDPFPLDDGVPDGEATLHDRALGVLKIALVDLDRLHFDTAHQVLVDEASVSGGAVTRGTTVTTVELAEAILALRNAFRALNGSLQLYSNDTPDTQGAPGALDEASLRGAPYTGTLQAHLIALIDAEASFLVKNLVSVGGAVANSYDLSKGAADASPTDLAAEAGAIRGLLDAYLATSNQTYRTTAIAIYQDLQQRFWQPDIYAFATTAGAPLMQWTPLRIGLLSGALRQYYKLVASAPSRAAEGKQLLLEFARTYKLVVNGWNHRELADWTKPDWRDQSIGEAAGTWPSECIGWDGGFPAGMEMGERVLTGELGHFGDFGERDHDCVYEISYVNLPAALAGELDIQRRP